MALATEARARLAENSLKFLSPIYLRDIKGVRPPCSLTHLSALTTPASSHPAERIKAVNHHLRVALDEVSDAVLILQDSLAPNEGPVIAWGNAAAVKCTGVPAADLFGWPLQPLLTQPSWHALLAALTQAMVDGTAACDLTFLHQERHAQRGRLKVTRGPQGEVLGVILTMAIAPVPGPETSPGSASVGQPVARPPLPAPSPEGWQDDVIETIRETARQVAHEFNNALTSIVLPVQLAIRAIPQNGDLFESLEVAHVSAQRASDLAKDFLDCFRPRSAVRSRCAPGALLGRSIRLATCAQNVETVSDIEAGLPEIDVDESQLERVIFNLIRNSVQAMPSGGRLRVAASKKELTPADGVALPPGPYLQIAVRDWGPGIPEEHLQHLFHGRFTTKPEGNGCGLPICYQIIKEHGGEMLVRSRVNVGTEFIIYLPISPILVSDATSAARPAPLDFPAGPALPPAAAPLLPPLLTPLGAPAPLAPLVPALAPLMPQTARVPAPAWATATAPVLPNRDLLPPLSAPYSTPAPAGPTAGAPVYDDALPSLLVVDDEQGVRTALSQIAKIMGFDVSTVATSDEALQSYKDRLHADRPFSTVLLDLNLRSGLNGMEVFQAIRRMDPEALVVATSGQHSEGDVERFRALGFAGFLPKPYSLEHFDSVMRAALAS